MRRTLCILLALLLLPCAALAEELTLFSEYPLQTKEQVEYLHDANLLPNGGLLLRYYTRDNSEFARNRAGNALFSHYMGIFTQAGERVWEDLPSAYDLTREQNGDTLIIGPRSFIWEYYPSGTALEYCWTEYDFSGKPLRVWLDMQRREEEILVVNLPHYTLCISFQAMQMGALSLVTDKEETLPVDSLGVIQAAEIDGRLAVLNRSEDSPAVIRLYNEDLTQVQEIVAPFDYGESVKMCAWNGKLHCFVLYAGDWESYCVYTCDLASGRWQEEPVYMQVPEERCMLRDVIPTDDGFLLLIDEGDLPDDPFPRAVGLNPANLYRMTGDGSLTRCLDLNGDARLLPVSGEDSFTLLMPGEAGGYVLRTYARN